MATYTRGIHQRNAGGAGCGVFVALEVNPFAQAYA